MVIETNKQEDRAPAVDLFGNTAKMTSGGMEAVQPDNVIVESEQVIQESPETDSMDRVHHALRPGNPRLKTDLRVLSHGAEEESLEKHVVRQSEAEREGHEQGQTRFRDWFLKRHASGKVERRVQSETKPEELQAEPIIPEISGSGGARELTIEGRQMVGDSAATQEERIEQKQPSDKQPTVAPIGDQAVSVEQPAAALTVDNPDATEIASSEGNPSTRLEAEPVQAIAPVLEEKEVQPAASKPNLQVLDSSSSASASDEGQGKRKGGISGWFGRLIPHGDAGSADFSRVQRSAEEDFWGQKAA